MKKIIITIIILVLLIGIGFGIYYIYNNTSFLRFSNQSQEVSENNQNILTEDEKIKGAMQQEELDLINLVAKKLEVDDKYLSGVFAQTRTLNLPQDFNINVYAAGLNAPRFMSFDNQGNMFVADKGSGAIYLLKDVDSNGVVDEQIEVDTKLRVIHCVYYHLGDLYAAEEDKILRYNDIDDNGNYSSKEILVANLPSDGGHSTRTVVVGPDHKLYVSIGSKCNNCEEADKRRAAIIRYNLDGSNEKIFAKGLRNSVGIQFYQGKLWGVNNGRDLIGDDIPPEEVNVIEEGKHYGWPYCYSNGIVSPEFPDRNEFCHNETEFPTYEMQAHSAPLGMDFVDNSKLPGLMADNMLIGFHGSWNRTVPTGYKVVRLDINDPNAETINFVTGWLENDGSAWGRPVDVEINSNGDIFISDDRAGAIYRVSYNK